MSWCEQKTKSPACEQVALRPIKPVSYKNSLSQDSEREDRLTEWSFSDFAEKYGTPKLK